MSLVDHKIQLSSLKLIVLSILSTAIIGFPMFRVQEIVNLPVDIFFVKVKFLYVIMISSFLVSFFVLWLFTRINIDRSKKFDKWERNNPGARMLFDQSIQEVYDEQSFWQWRSIFSILVIMAFLFIIVISPDYTKFPISSSLLYLHLFNLVLGLGVIFWDFAFFLGNHRRVYYRKGQIIILDRMIPGFIQPGANRKKLAKYADMEYDEIKGKNITRFRLRLSGRMKVTIAESANFDKINSLRKKIDNYT